MGENRKGRQGAEETSVVEDLVVAILAVNFWTLEKVYALRSRLAEQGLFDMQGVSDLDVGEVDRRLRAAGYERGDFPVFAMANRLVHTACALDAGGETKLRALLAQGGSHELDDFLLGLKGVGPVVVGNFKVLQEIEG